jgi:hypothetical protein
MKKMFLLIAFLFAVVCYAAPPPVQSTAFLIEDVGDFRSQCDIAIQLFDVPEVTFVYIGNRLQRIRTVPNKSLLNYGFINRLHDWKPNKQHPNFGYPLGADY